VYKYFMDHKPVLPEGWALPDVLARKVSEALNKKSISPEDELVDALEDMARDIALIEPNPADWDGGWLTYCGADGGGSHEPGSSPVNRRRY
jgi:hypothetical protein